MVDAAVKDESTPLIFKIYVSKAYIKRGEQHGYSLILELI